MQNVMNKIIKSVQFGGATIVALTVILLFAPARKAKAQLSCNTGVCGSIAPDGTCLFGGSCINPEQCACTCNVGSGQVYCTGY